MSSTLSTNVSRKSLNRLSGWDMAICDAENEVRKAQARVERLTLSIANFKQFRDQGEPFPGEKKTRRRKAKEL